MENDSQDKSRTQKKKAAEQVQKLGEELIKLSRVQLESMALPGALRDALIAAQSIKSNNAGKRQRQFIGSLMRDIDPEPIRAALLQIDAGPPIEPEDVQEAQVWQERLLTDDPDAVDAFIRACPEVERQRLNQLLRNIKKVKAAGKSAKSLNALTQLILEAMDGR